MENRIIDENFSVRGFMTSNQGVGNEGREGDFGLFVPPLSKSAKLKNYRKKNFKTLFKPLKFDSRTHSQVARNQSHVAQIFKLCRPIFIISK